MALSIYHVSGTTKETPYSSEVIPFRIGVCADGKTDAARIVRERVLRDGYATFTWRETERVCAAGEWEPGQTLWY